MSSTIYDPGLHRPGKRKEPFALGIIMKDNFTDHTQHAISKYLMTYIYILLLRKTARLLGGGDEFLVHASVQARTGKGKGGTEGSHILLREVSFGGTYVYNLAQIPQGLKSALVYCAAQVTVTPGSYNRTDQLLEEPEPTLGAYLSLVRVALMRRRRRQPRDRSRGRGIWRSIRWSWLGSEACAPRSSRGTPRTGCTRSGWTAAGK
jgi:hypothetical protein